MSETHEFRWPPNSRKCHVFLKSDIRSLCMKWLYSGHPQPIETVPIVPTKEDCAECAKRFNKSLPKAKS